ncbi:MAG: ABC transporter substrate-binding protein [Nocardioides sp.]|uniref:ABC transporter substrate-binding protein n=1 Tax=Nocardioides sp. TaxID=35761 RepID=UPI0039E5C730
MTHVSRRTLLSGVAGGVVLLGIAGCSSAVEDSKSGTPTSGGTLLGGIGIDLVPANFYTNSNFGVTTIIGLVYESLLLYPLDSLEPQARLATDWQISDDGLTVTLNLRKGVTFHSGREFTSKDVAFSLKTYADPAWNGQMQSTAATIASYDTSQKHQVVLTLKHPLGNILDLLEVVPIVDSESIDGLKDGSKYIGTGPFKFEKWTPNSRLTFTKNDDYWVDGRPYLDGVDIAIVTDTTQLFSQIRSGQVDYAFGTSFTDNEKLDTSKFTITKLSGAEEQIYLGANVTADPLDDLTIRQAIAYAIDRDRIMKEVYRNSGYAVNLPWPKYSTAYDAKLNQTYTLDLAKAKSLVAKHEGTLPTIPLTYASDIPSYEATAQIIQANLKEIGITVKLDPVDPATFVSQLIGAKFKGLWTTFHSWAQYTPSTLTISAYPFNAAHNASNYSDAGYTKDATTAWQQVDGTSSQAVSAYGAVSQDLLDALFLIEIGVIEDQWVTSSAVSGVTYTKRHEVILTDAKLAS